MNRRQKKKMDKKIDESCFCISGATSYRGIRQSSRYYQELVTAKEREVGLYPNKRRWKTIKKECLKNWDRRRNKESEK